MLSAESVILTSHIDCLLRKESLKFGDCRVKEDLRGASEVSVAVEVEVVVVVVVVSAAAAAAADAVDVVAVVVVEKDDEAVHV